MERFVGGVSMRRSEGREVHGPWPFGVLDLDESGIVVRLRFGGVFGADSRFDAAIGTVRVEPCQGPVVKKGIRLTNERGDRVLFWTRKSTVIDALESAGCVVSRRVVDVRLGDYL